MKLNYYVLQQTISCLSLHTLKAVVYEMLLRVVYEMEDANFEDLLIKDCLDFSWKQYSQLADWDM